MTQDGDMNDDKFENLKQHTEFETKYRVEGDLVYKFKSIVSELDYKNFVYAEGPDYYYTKPDKKNLSLGDRLEAVRCHQD